MPLQAQSVPIDFTNGGYSVSPRTRAKQEEFIAVYSEVGVISQACKIVGIQNTRHYEWLSNDPTYPERFAAAHERAIDVLETEARRRAIEGVEKPTGWYKGEPGGIVREYSDVLLIFLLNGARPEKYRHRHEITGRNGGPIQIDQGPQWFEYCTQEEKLEILAIAERAIERATSGGQGQTIDVPPGSDSNVQTKMIGSGSTDDRRDDDTDDDYPTTSRLKQVYDTRSSKSDWKPGPGGRPPSDKDYESDGLDLIDLMGDD